MKNVCGVIGWDLKFLSLGLYNIGDREMSIEHSYNVIDMENFYH